MGSPREGEPQSYIVHIPLTRGKSVSSTVKQGSLPSRVYKKYKHFYPEDNELEDPIEKTAEGSSLIPNKELKPTRDQASLAEYQRRINSPLPNE